MIASVYFALSISAHHLFGFCFLLQLSLFDILCDDIVVKRSWNGWIELLGSGDECTHHILVDSLVVHLLTAWSDQVLVDRGHVQGKSFVFGLVVLVQEQEDQIETREEGLGEIDILLRRLGWVVPAVEGVGCSKNRSPCIKTGCDACLGD